VHPGRARFLLTAGHAAVLRRYPFTLILKAAGQETYSASLRLKIDPGAKTTGLAVVHDTTGQVVWAAELAHRGEQVKERLDQRHACRRSRRQRHTRYRPARFANRRRRLDGWSPSSLESRIATVLTWVARLRRWRPIGALSLELVKFDTQLMQNAEISGVEYQQGTLTGYEVKEYLLEKWAAAVRLLWRDRPTAASRAYCAAGAPRLRSGLQPHPGLRDLQSGQGQAHGGGVWVSPDPGAGAAAVARCGGGECDALGALPPACCAGTAPRDGNRRTNEVEPHAA
jgi:RRXRR protein